MVSSHSSCRQMKWRFSLLTALPSLLAFGRSGLFGPPLCGGSAPATPPANNMPRRPGVVIGDMCPIERVSTDHSHQSHQIPMGAGLVPAHPPYLPPSSSPLNPPVGAGLVPAHPPYASPLPWLTKKNLLDSNPSTFYITFTHARNTILHLVPIQPIVGECNRE